MEPEVQGGGPQPGGGNVATLRPEGSAQDDRGAPGPGPGMPLINGDPPRFSSAHEPGHQCPRRHAQWGEGELHHLATRGGNPGCCQACHGNFRQVRGQLRLDNGVAVARRSWAASSSFFTTKEVGKGTAWAWPSVFGIVRGTEGNSCQPPGSRAHLPGVLPVGSKVRSLKHGWTRTPDGQGDERCC